MEMNANEIREASAKLRAEGDALVAKGGPRSVRNGSSAIVAANIADALADAIGSGIFVHTARSLMDAIEGAGINVGSGSADQLLAAYSATGETPPAIIAATIAAWHKAHG